MTLGLIVRREGWALSRRGYAVLLAAALVIAIAVRVEAYSFLATNQPIEADVLVVEGWISDILLDQTASEFRRGHYRQLLLAVAVYDRREPHGYVPGTNSHENKLRLLVDYGVPRESMGVLYYPAVQRDRTYHGALAVKKWFSETDLPVKFNVVTEGPHARRSWFLNLKAIGNEGELGIVALTDPRFDPKHWWRTSEGVREVLGEAIAYVYARFFFIWIAAS